MIRLSLFRQKRARSCAEKVVHGGLCVPTKRLTVDAAVWEITSSFRNFQQVNSFLFYFRSNQKPKLNLIKLQEQTVFLSKNKIIKWLTIITDIIATDRTRKPPGKSWILETFIVCRVFFIIFIVQWQGSSPSSRAPWKQASSSQKWTGWKWTSPSPPQRTQCKRAWK